MRILLDTGPWVALLCRKEPDHLWAMEQFRAFAAPFYTCESVVNETTFLLARGGFDPAQALRMIEAGIIRVEFGLGSDIAAVRALFERYDNVPASLADACLIRMSELHEPSKVLTLDSDFKIYRRHGRKVVPTILPPDR